MAIAPEDVQPSFDSNARKYRCCFSCCCHVRICAKIIAAFEVSVITIIFISALVCYVNHQTLVKQPSEEHQNGNGHFKKLRRDQQSEWNESRWNSTQEEDQPDLGLQLAVSIFVFIIVWLAVILLFFGIKKTKPKCLLPHLFLQGLSILYNLVMTLVYGVQLGITSNLTLPPKSGFVIYAVASVLDVFFFVCVFRCYCYLKAKRRSAPVCRMQKEQIHEEGGAASPV